MISPGALNSATPSQQYVHVLMPASSLQPALGQQQHPVGDVAMFSQPAQRPQGQTGVYGIQNYGVQKYLPIAEHRDLAPEERSDAQQGLQQWFPKIGAGYSTPMSQLLASPAKSAILSGGVMGLAGVALGACMRHSVVAAVLGGLGAALGGFTGFINRRQQNENVLDLMGRFPQGATKRDMLSDPVYQSDLRRREMARAAAMNGGGGLDLMTGMMLASSFNRSGSGRR